MKSTPHAHTTYVDGINKPLEMAEAAILRGFDSLGFSEHGKQDFDTRYCLSEESEARYLEEVGALKARFAGTLPIHVGVERDEYGLSDRKKHEYVIGSKHYFFARGQHYAVDGRIEDILLCQSTLFSGDWIQFAARYFSELADYVSDFRPDIIGHFDIVTKYNEGGARFDEADARYLDAGFLALDRMKKSGALLEINTGAIARGYRSAPYPSLRFLAYWHDIGGKAILGSDCHDARKLDCAFDQAIALAKAAGYDHLYALGREKALFERYSI
ncbi:MAG: PHP domain-containing protein [Clostridia bacterium]